MTINPMRVHTHTHMQGGGRDVLNADSHELADAAGRGGGAAAVPAPAAHPAAAGSAQAAALTAAASEGGAGVCGVGARGGRQDTQSWRAGVRAWRRAQPAPSPSHVACCGHLAGAWQAPCPHRVTGARIVWVGRMDNG
jgi:hypothetical protein